MNYAAPIHGSRIGEDIEVQIPRVRFQPRMMEPESSAPIQEPPRMRIRDRIRDPALFRLCDDKECMNVHISPLKAIQENYIQPSSTKNWSTAFLVIVAVLFLVIVYMAFNNIYPFRFFENLMF